MAKITCSRICLSVKSV